MQSKDQYVVPTAPGGLTLLARRKSAAMGNAVKYALQHARSVLVVTLTGAMSADATPPATLWDVLVDSVLS